LFEDEVDFEWVLVTSDDFPILAESFVATIVEAVAVGPYFFPALLRGLF